MKVKKKKKNWTTPTLLLSTVASMMLQWGGDNEEEVAVEHDWGDDALMMPSMMHKENVKVRKRRPSSSAC